MSLQNQRKHLTVFCARFSDGDRSGDVSCTIKVLAARVNKVKVVECQFCGVTVEVIVVAECTISARCGNGVKRQILNIGQCHTERLKFVREFSLIVEFAGLNFTLYPVKKAR